MSRVSSAPSRLRSRPPLQHPQLAPYAPIIRRAADEVQVGVDPDAALVFRGAGFTALLDLLDGAQPTSAVRRAARAAGFTAAQVRGALDAHATADLSYEGGTKPYAGSASRLTVRLIGAGPVGYELARLLVASGLGALYVYDDEPTDLALYPAAGVLSCRSEALRSALVDGETIVFPLSHWSKPEGVQVDLTIVACDQPEPDRVITDHLLRNDHPHVMVRCWGNGVSVGPLVLAGQTSCVRCADLARSDADPHWPAVLRQLSRVRIATPAALRAWAASTAAAQVLAFLHGELPESAGATLEISWPSFITRLRHWAAHPDCGCSWLRQTE
jgi:hypothetical protein